MVLVAFRVPSLDDEGPVDLMRRLSDGFRGAGLAVAPPVVVDVERAELERTGVPLSPEAWSRVFRENADADILVSLAGIPHRPSAAADPELRPRTLVIWEAPASGLSRAAAARADVVILRRLDAEGAEGNYRVIRAASP